MLARQKNVPPLVLVNLKGRLQGLKRKIQPELKLKAQLTFVYPGEAQVLGILKGEINSFLKLLQNGLQIETFQSHIASLQKIERLESLYPSIDSINEFLRILAFAKDSLEYELNKPEKKVKLERVEGVDDADLPQPPKKVAPHAKDILHKQKMKDKEKDVRLEKNSAFPHRVMQHQSVGKKLNAFGQFASRQKAKSSFTEDLNIKNRILRKG
jgi:hypothetical protein